jgi:hypothetical protein
MLEINKIPNGLNFNNEDHYFTFNMLPNGYNINGNNSCDIELGDSLYFFQNGEFTLDGQVTSSIQDFITQIYS